MAMTFSAADENRAARDQAVKQERADGRARSLKALTAGVVILAVLAIVFALQFTRDFLVPIIIGILFSSMLDPVSM